MRSVRLALVPLAAFAVLLVRPVAAAEGDSDHADHPHQLVRIFEGRVRPSVQEISPEDALGWLNYTSRIARVSFDQEVAKHMTCTSPSGFRLDGERLVSRDIQSTQFATLCSLAPGEYDYVVTLHSGIGTERGPDRQIAGKIRVSE